jgi:hypothetical protein
VHLLWGASCMGVPMCAWRALSVVRASGSDVCARVRCRRFEVKVTSPWWSGCLTADVMYGMRTVQLQACTGGGHTILCAVLSCRFWCCWPLLAFAVGDAPGCTCNCNRPSGCPADDRQLFRFDRTGDSVTTVTVKAGQLCLEMEPGRNAQTEVSPRWSPGDAAAASAVDHTARSAPSARGNGLRRCWPAAEIRAWACVHNTHA